jgi:selenocysteine lyase/cysteine desulfurase
MARMTIYLNAGGHGLPSAATRARLLTHARCEAEAGSLAALSMAEAELTQLRAKAARLVGTTPAQVALGHTTSQFWLAAIARLPLSGRRLLIAPHEWGNHLRHLRHVAPDLGLRLDILPRDEALDPAAWAARMDEDVAALLLPQVTSAQGLVYPVTRIAALPRPEQTLVIVDAAQSLGRIEVPQGWDVLAGTARKWLRGPRATALLALSPRASAVLGVQAAGLEPMDANVALRLGMAAALDQVLTMGVTQAGARLNDVAALFRRALGRDDRLAGWLAAGTPAGEQAPGHITLAVPASERARLAQALERAGIVAKWPDPAVEEPQAQLNPGVALLRITPHLDNDAAEAEALAAALAG